jgi:hypothetical protein
MAVADSPDPPEAQLPSGKDGPSATAARRRGHQELGLRPDFLDVATKARELLGPQRRRKIDDARRVELESGSAWLIRRFIDPEASFKFVSY